jgi:hypothetical protein
MSLTTDKMPSMIGSNVRFVMSFSKASKTKCYHSTTTYISQQFEQDIVMATKNRRLQGYSDTPQKAVQNDFG